MRGDRTFVIPEHARRRQLPIAKLDALAVIAKHDAGERSS